MKKKLFSDARGFTLVEVIVVMLVMSVVSMAAMSLIIPVQRSASSQSQLVDVQGNLRMALERMAKDFRNAGFLYDNNPVIGYDAGTKVSTTSITIRSLAVSAGYAVTDVPPATPADPFTLRHPEQFQNFADDNYGAPPHKYVVVIEPVNRTVVGGDIYRVGAASSAGVKLVDKTTGSDLAGVGLFNDPGFLAGLVLLPVPSANLADINRTITYAHVDTNGDGINDTVTRQVNGGAPQNFVRNVTGVRFEVNEVIDGADVYVDRVEIELTGETKATSTGGDAIGSVKSKSMRTVVALRNV